MKKVVFLFTLIGYSIFMLAFQTAPLPHSGNHPLIKFKDDKLEVMIDNQATDIQLKELAQLLKTQYKIDLNYENLNRKSNQKIKSLAIKVKTNDGYSGSASSDHHFRDAFVLYFYRDYKQTVSSTFGIGVEWKKDHLDFFEE